MDVGKTLFNDPAYLAVDLLGCLLAVPAHPLIAGFGREKRGGIILTVVHSSESTHPIVHDHAASNVGSSRQVVLGSS